MNSAVKQEINYIQLHLYLDQNMTEGSFCRKSIESRENIVDMMLWVEILLSSTFIIAVNTSPVSPPDCDSFCSSCPPEVITYGENIVLSRNLPITIEEPLIQESQSRNAHVYRPDPFTGKSYGTSMFAPPPSSPVVQSLGAFDTVLEDPLAPEEIARLEKPRVPSMQIQVIPTDEGEAPARPLGLLPITVHEPLVPVSRSQETPLPPKLLQGLSARVDRIVVPASDIIPEPSTPESTSESCHWIGHACSCNCS